MTDSLSSDPLLDVALTPEQEKRAHDLYVDLCTGGLLKLQRTARLMVHLLDQVAETTGVAAALEKQNATLERSNKRLREKCDRLADTAMARSGR